MKYLKLYEEFNSEPNLIELMKQHAVKFNSIRDGLKQGREFATTLAVPKLNWNENSGTLIFADENGEIYVGKISNELRTMLNEQGRKYIKNEGIDVPNCNDGTGWTTPDGWERWKNL